MNMFNWFANRKKTINSLIGMIRLQLFLSWQLTDSNDPFRASHQWTELTRKNREILWTRVHLMLRSYWSRIFGLIIVTENHILVKLLVVCKLNLPKPCKSSKFVNIAISIWAGFRPQEYWTRGSRKTFTRTDIARHINVVICCFFCVQNHVLDGCQQQLKNDCIYYVQVSTTVICIMFFVL